MVTQILYESSKLNYRLSQNVHDMRWNHKVYWEHNGKLESGTNSRRKKLSWGENSGNSEFSFS